MRVPVVLPPAVREHLRRHPWRPGIRPAPPAWRRRPGWLALLLVLPLACDAESGKDVRFQPSPMPVVRAMLELAGVGPGDVVYDLGSGDGRIPITAAREFGARGVGIDIDPDLVAQARLRAQELGVADRVRFIEGDMYAADVRAATVVTLFLHPEPNLKLRPKLRRQLPPGARVVSYVWDMGDWEPDAVREINDRHIYLWRIDAAGPPTEAPGR